MKRWSSLTLLLSMRANVLDIGIHTANACRGYEIGKIIRGAWVIYGGIHATLYPDEVCEQNAVRDLAQALHACYEHVQC